MKKIILLAFSFLYLQADILNDLKNVEERIKNIDVNNLVPKEKIIQDISNKVHESKGNGINKTQGYKKEDKDISNSFQHYCVKGIIHLKTKGELYPLLDKNNKYIKCKEK